jgi:hypothetical protein
MNFSLWKKTTETYTYALLLRKYNYVKFYIWTHTRTNITLGIIYWSVIINVFYIHTMSNASGHIFLMYVYTLKQKRKKRSRAMEVI